MFRHDFNVSSFIFLLTATVNKQYTDSVNCWVTFTICLTYIHFIFSLLNVDAETCFDAVDDRPWQTIFSVIRRWVGFFFCSLWVLSDVLSDARSGVLFMWRHDTIKLSQSWDTLILVKIRISIIRMWSFTLLFLKGGARKYVLSRTWWIAPSIFYARRA